MISTGNDIVSLTATNVIRTKSPEFYSKIISLAERALFDTLDQSALPFDRFVWLLWSVKESAYKYLNRLNPGIVFTPVKFEVQSIEIPPGYSCSGIFADEFTRCGFKDMVSFNGLVVFEDKKLFSKTMIFNEFIASFVNANNDFETVFWGVKRIEDTAYKCQSAMIRDFTLNTLCKVLGSGDLIIGKNDDEIPVVSNKGKRLDVPVSLSHHEHWVAFSFQIPASSFFSDG
jgi:phosphopantetheinyl transferase (holo-ACP synthase)